MPQLEISLILTNGGTQPRASLNQESIDEYAEAMLEKAKFPPLTVFYDGTKYWLADGFHRLEAAKKIGSTKIAVDIRQGTRRDAVLYSAGANATHGLRRSNADKRRSVLTLLSDYEWSEWSNNEIAKRCGVAEWLVRKLKEELSSFSTKIDQEYAKKCGVDEDTLKNVQQILLTQPEERTAQRKGTTYSISTANIGRHNTKISSIEESEKEVSETKASEVVFLTSSQALPPECQSAIQVVDVSAQERDKKAENQIVEAIGSFVEQDSEVALEVQPENIYPSKESLGECVRVISIKQDIPQPIEESIQTFEVTFFGVCVEIEGRPDILITLFEQMRDNPTFTEKVLQQAQLLSDSDYIAINTEETREYAECEA